MRPGSYLAPKAVLELKHVGRTGVLDGVSLRVRRGELLCLLGPAGCGKSTLFRICAGLEEPDAGQVLVDGQPVQGPGPDRGVVFADGALFPWLTVRGNVEFGLTMQNVPSGERRERCDQALDLVRLRKFSDACIHELSGGMRQRVAIARAVVLRPQVLLMDEPFATLDAQTRNIMQEELQRIWAQTGTAVLFVTSNVSEAVRLGDRVAVMSYRSGRIKREVPIHRARPRLADDPHLLEVRTFLVRDLKEDAHLAVEEELGDA